MLDFLKIRCDLQEIVEKVRRNIPTTYGKSYTNNGGKREAVYKSPCSNIRLKFGTQFYNNGQAARRYVQIEFSAHKLKNGGLHNADRCTMNEARAIMVNTLSMFGIERADYYLFRIIHLELGVNFSMMRCGYEILNTAIKNGKTYYFHIPDKGKPHYTVAGREGKNFKGGRLIKFYIKAEQKDDASVKTYAELGYCEADTMRYEVKILDTKQHKAFGWHNLENLFTADGEQRLRNILMKQVGETFFYDHKSIDKRKLTNIQLKHLHKWEDRKDYFRKLRGKKFSRERNIYEGMPKLYDFQEQITNAIANEVNRANPTDFNWDSVTHEKEKTTANSPTIQSEGFEKVARNSPTDHCKKWREIVRHQNGILNSENHDEQRDEMRFTLPFQSIDAPFGELFYKDENLLNSTQDDRCCIVTKLPIGMQKKGSRFLNTTGLNFYRAHHPDAYAELERMFLRDSNASTIEELNYNIAHNIRNTYTNYHRDRKKFEERYYPKEQLQFAFVY